MILLFLLAGVISKFTVIIVIDIANKRGLFDLPDQPRKIHKQMIPNLGGVALFSGLILTQQLFIQPDILQSINQVLACGTLLFLVGLQDDLIGIAPVKKLAAQFVAVSVVVIIGDIHMNCQPYSGCFIGVCLAVIIQVVIINSINLIDGADGLAATLSLLVAITYAYLFNRCGDQGWCYLALALAGSLSGFLLYNVAPAKIFMGDSGSLFVGYFIAVMSIRLLSLPGVTAPFKASERLLQEIVIIIAAMIVPVFDTFRIILVRLLTNAPPFTADRNHLHHRLIMSGMSHSQVTMALTLVTSLAIISALAGGKMNFHQPLWIIFIVPVLLYSTLSLYLDSRFQVVQIEDIRLNDDEIRIIA